MGFLKENNWQQQVKSYKLLGKCIRKNKTQNSQKWTQNGCPVFQWRVPVAAVLIYRLLIATYTAFWLIYSTVKQDVSVNMFSLFFQWQWTVPHLSVMIIYYSTRSILIQWIRVILTIWPSKNKRKPASCLWETLSHTQINTAERGGDWTFAELCIDMLDKRPKYLLSLIVKCVVKL